jgi:E3 ubiquitin-protein ligase RGLG
VRRGDAAARGGARAAGSAARRRALTPLLSPAVTNGAKSFGGKSLHDVDGPGLNPYQRVISIMGKFLAPFDEDGLIPCYGFGDRRTQDDSVFAFHEVAAGSGFKDEVFCEGLDSVLAAYSARIGSVALAGPTSFAPAIRRTMELVKRSTPREFTFALIIADGQVSSTRETIAAIIDASALPISIVCIGVGDGPWEAMEHFDDELQSASSSSGRQRFDNFHFTEYDLIAAAVAERGGSLEAAIVADALSEVPKQFAECKRLRLI